MIRAANGEEKRMNAIVNGRILLPREEITGKALLYDEKILGLEEETPRDAQVIDAKGLYVSPGFIDTHIHGFLGDDASDGDPEGIRRMARALPAVGVTAFLPTTMTMPMETLAAVFASVRSLMRESRESSFSGAQILGCHAEGPFINPEKKGAQAAEHILPPDPEPILPFADVIRILTLAPEMPGAEGFIRRIRKETGIVLSMGHTCASFEQAMAAIGWGVSRATHLFNAMPPVNHRAPGAAAAALQGGVYAELIADGFHVHPGLFPLLHRLLDSRLVLITDAARAAGMPDGDYTLGGQRFRLSAGQCRLPDGTLAGSALKMNDAVRIFHDHAGVPMHAAVRAASLNAARSIGAEKTKGSLETGKDADILLLDEGCRVRRAIISGRTVYRA